MREQLFMQLKMYMQEAKVNGVTIKKGNGKKTQKV
jgi:hypothetical protein